MDPGLGDVADGDVLVQGSQITAVGPGLTAPGAAEIDARGMIVAPGLVDTHWHLWNTLLRSMSDGGSGYFRVTVALGRVFGPDDVYQGTRLGCAEAINSGLTTVHDWCHNLRSPAHAEAALRALTGSGLRARFSYGYAAGHGNDQPMDLAGLAALHRDWAAWSAAGRLSLGMAWRGPGGSNPAMRVPPAIYQQEIATARGLGLPVTVHACGPRTACGQIAAWPRPACSGRTCRWCTPTARPTRRSRRWPRRAARSACPRSASCSSGTGCPARLTCWPPGCRSACPWTAPR